MAQGTVKKASKPTSKKPSQKIQRGSRVIKPKKTTLITQNKIKQQRSAGLVGKTEKLLAEKAGHLEMLKGGKKDRMEKQKKEAAKKA